MDYLSSISSAVMALVWVVYFQVFFVQYKRNSRPYLVIHHAQNENPDAMCLLVNMGKEPVHVQCVQAAIYSQDGTEKTLTVTEYRRVNADDQNIQRTLRQGPLEAGGYLVLGSFRNIVLGNKSEDENAGELLEDIAEFELRAAVVHGPSKYPVGARRRFVLKHQGGTLVYPYNIHSEQLVRKKDRTIVRRWLEEELNPQCLGESESDSSRQSD